MAEDQGIRWYRRPPEQHSHLHRWLDTEGGRDHGMPSMPYPYPICEWDDTAPPNPGWDYQKPKEYITPTRIDNPTFMCAKCIDQLSELIGDVFLSPSDYVEPHVRQMLRWL